MSPLFSLVVCTIGRTDDLIRLFDSLALQTLTSFEVVLVDQSGADQVAQAIARKNYSFPIAHLRSRRGLSLGRNVALGSIRGSFVSFPDDDCGYPPETLAKVKNWFERNPDAAGLSGRSLDFDGSPSGPRAMDASVEITASNIWRCAISYTIFLRREVIDSVGVFDEGLGVGCGTPYQSGEETDYLLRALSKGMTLVYIPQLVVHHPKINVPNAKELILKDYRYAVGMGHVVRKNRLGIGYFFPHICKPLVGSLLSLAKGNLTDARRYLQRARGRLAGFIGSPTGEIAK